MADLENDSDSPPCRWCISEFTIDAVASADDAILGSIFRQKPEVLNVSGGGGKYDNGKKA